MIGSWHDFYVMAGGAIAALTGLLFVAMSIHLREILAVKNLTRNVGIALYGMLSQLLFCGFMVVPGLTMQQAGGAIIVIGLLFAAGYARYGRPRNAFDLICNAGMGVLGVATGVLVMLGWGMALYLYAALLGVSVVALIRLCWRLLTMAIDGLEDDLEAIVGAAPTSRMRELRPHRGR